ncbi:MAG: efflux RND transporter permease subunit [Planctomycetes bacterium]|nr:efflux RND transporter permease subunit [Planctomycetota bacterium]
MEKEPEIVPHTIGEALANFSIKKKVLTNLLFVLLFLAGFLVVDYIAIEEYPRVEFYVVAITVRFPGASPEEVEKLVTKKIEDEVSDVEGISFIRSESRQDMSIVLVQFDQEIADYDKACRELETEVDRVTDLPEDAEDPKVERINVQTMYPATQIIVGTRVGAPAVSETALRKAALDLEDVLTGIDGVAQIDYDGYRDREIWVEVDRDKLKSLNLTIADVANALRAANRNVPSGDFTSGGQAFSIRQIGEWSDPREILDVHIPLASGVSIRVSEVAKVVDTFDEDQRRTRINGHKGVRLGVVTSEGTNTLDLMPKVKEAVEEFRKKCPDNMDFVFVMDTSIRITDRMGVLTSNLLMGGAVVFLALYLFLGFRNSMLAVIGIPFCFLVSLIFLHFLGETINEVSIFAFVLVCGIVVDDAIIIIENIYRRFEEGEPLRIACVKGTGEVMWPVMASMLTTIAAFLPMLIMTGITGEFFAVMPKAVTVVLLVSIFEAVIILPAHVYEFGPKKVHVNSREHGFVSRMLKRYESVLRFCLSKRKSVIASIVLIASISIGLVFAGVIPVVFFPSDFPYFQISLKAPPGSTLDETERLCEKIENLMNDWRRDEVKSVDTSIGRLQDANFQFHHETYYAQMIVTLADPGVRTKDSRVILDEVNEFLSSRAGELGFATIDVSELSDGPPVGRDVTMRIRGDEYETLGGIAAKIERRLAELSRTRGVTGITSDYEIGRPELRFIPDQEKIERYGLDNTAVGLALSSFNDGVIATTFREGEEEADVRVKSSAPNLMSIRDLRSAYIRRRDGTLFALSEICDEDNYSGVAIIRRYDRKRCVQITADVNEESGHTAAEVNRILMDEFGDVETRHPGYQVDFAGEFQETNRSFESLGKAYFIAMLLIFLILGAQFGSYAQPLVILFTVPFSLIGVMFGLLVTGDPFTVGSFIAIVGLSGIVVNDSIVLVDFINRERKRGVPLDEAIPSAGVKRMRAVLLTTITTVAGLLPMSLGLGGRSITWGPMATSLAFGLIFATALTLLVIPCLYSLVEHAKIKLGLNDTENS